jgi:hypothetical protein
MLLDLRTRLTAGYPADRYTRLYVVVDTYTIHHAKAIEQWLAAHPRLTLLWLPTYGPRANPIERAFGHVHDCCTHNHRRKRLPDLVADVEEHVHLTAPRSISWQIPTLSRQSPLRLRTSPPRNTQKLPRGGWPGISSACSLTNGT